MHSFMPSAKYWSRISRQISSGTRVANMICGSSRSTSAQSDSSSRVKQDNACRRRVRLARRGTRQRSSEGPASRRACDARLVDTGPVWQRGSASDHHLLRLETNRLFCPGSRTMQRTLLSRGHWLRPSLLLMENVALLLSPETPWRILVISIARSRRYYGSLAALLLRDGLVSQDAMAHWEQAKNTLRLNRQTPVLCRPDQPFVYPLDSRELRLYVADGLDVRKVQLKGFLGDRGRLKSAALPTTYPYSGTHCNPLRWH
jgi:hypothetical protein